MCGILNRGLGDNLRRAQWFVLLVLAAVAAVAVAEPPQTGADDPANPVAQVRKNQSWEYGPFLNWGTGVGDRSDYKFFWGGFELGKVMTGPIHAGIFSGQFQLAGNVMPLWQAYTPAPHVQTFFYTGGPCPSG